jgi:hypothetical protein
MKMSAERLALMDAPDPVANDFGNEIPFSEPVASFDHSRSRPLIVLILDNRNRIIRAAVGHRGYSGGTALSQLQLTANVASDPITTGPYVAAVPARFRQRIRATIEKNGLVSPAASWALLERLAEQRAIRSVILSANRISHNPIEDFTERQQLRIQQERDAGFTAMLIAGIDRKPYLDQSSGRVESGRWFMDQVIDSRLREDPMVINDAQLFPGFSAFQRHISGAVRVRQNNVVLSIFMVNRQPLEELTGTDLIYYNETFGSFVMVQYKAMEPGHDGDVFRLPNERLDEEIERMRSFEAELDPPENLQSLPTAFRFHHGGFFLKFCPRTMQQPTEPDLVPGMYFPLDHWTLLNNQNHLAGQRGGRALRFLKAHPFTNADRYLNNSEFAMLVKGGWVGTAINQSRSLRDVIASSLRSGRSVTLATARALTEGNE